MRVEAVKTPATRETFARSLVVAWWSLLQTQPSRESILMLTAQCAFECGWFQHLWNNNVGNGKSQQKGGDWCFRECGELLVPTRADALHAADPDTVKLGPLVDVSLPGEAPILRRSVTFFPDHPACCFRAHPTLDAGVRGHLAMLLDNFESAWPHVLSGDIRSAVTALSGRYFTDAPAHYEYVWRDCLRQLGGIEIDLSPPPVDITGALAAVQDASLRMTGIENPDEHLRRHRAASRVRDRSHVRDARPHHRRVRRVGSGQARRRARDVGREHRLGHAH